MLNANIGLLLIRRYPRLRILAVISVDLPDDGSSLFEAYALLGRRLGRSIAVKIRSQGCEVDLLMACAVRRCLVPHSN